MLSLKAQTREEKGKKTRDLKNQGLIPAVLYGPKIKPQAIGVNAKDFKKIYKEAGESSLINLELDKKKFSVLIHDIRHDNMDMGISHIDFYQPNLDKEVEVEVPLIFEGISIAVKDLKGTLIKEIHELKVKSLPQNLPHSIKVDISSLNTFDDSIKIKDLVLPSGVKTLKDPEDIIALVTPPQKIEEELSTPIEEKVEDVEKVETKKAKEEQSEETQENA